MLAACIVLLVPPGRGPLAPPRPPGRCSRRSAGWGRSSRFCCGRRTRCTAFNRPVGLAAACVCLVPWVGFLSGDEFAAGVNFRTCVAGIPGLAALVARSGMGGVPARDGARLCLATAAVTFALLVPLDYLWFVLLKMVA